MTVKALMPARLNLVVPLARGHCVNGALTQSYRKGST